MQNGLCIARLPAAGHWYNPKMKWRRRQILGGMLAAWGSRAKAAQEEKPAMFGMIGKMLAVPGRREELIALLLQGTAEMPGCLSYIVARDSADDAAIWITEVWIDKASHDASLSLPSVRKTIAAARPMIAGFSSSTVTTPIGGVGLPRR
jgi:quinol monooxygenase YgiN